MKGGRLSRKYIIVLVALVTGTLLASGAIEIYSSYDENKDALVALQREKARGAAYRIETFVQGDRAPARLDHPAAAGARRRPRSSSAASTPSACSGRCCPSPRSATSTPGARAAARLAAGHGRGRQPDRLLAATRSSARPRPAGRTSAPSTSARSPSRT